MPHAVTQPLFRKIFHVHSKMLVACYGALATGKLPQPPSPAPPAPKPKKLSAAGRGQAAADIRWYLRGARTLRPGLVPEGDAESACAALELFVAKLRA